MLPQYWLLIRAMHAKWLDMYPNYRSDATIPPCYVPAIIQMLSDHSITVDWEIFNVRIPYACLINEI